MPIIINEIVIKTNVEQQRNNVGNTTDSTSATVPIDEIVQQAVEKVMELLEEKKQR
ncbi:MAG TPA: DUF5908 family protein [Edaphocola sp.]|nr:DUF5908 family protein [Edaphocola sp.]